MPVASSARTLDDLGGREEITRDVVVIGAGPAGLMAARTLQQAGRSVAVLEARSRVGGRTWNGKVLDVQGREHFIEIGGQWISPDQSRLSALVEELGLSTFPATETEPPSTSRPTARATSTRERSSCLADHAGTHGSADRRAR